MSKRRQAWLDMPDVVRRERGLDLKRGWRLTWTHPCRLRQQAVPVGYFCLSIFNLDDFPLAARRSGLTRSMVRHCNVRYSKLFAISASMCPSVYLQRVPLLQRGYLPLQV